MAQILTLAFGRNSLANQVRNQLRNGNILSELRKVSRGNTHLRIHVPTHTKPDQILIMVRSAGYRDFTSFVVEEETPVATLATADYSAAEARVMAHYADSLTPDCLIVTKLDNGWQVERVKSIGTDKGRSTICTTCGGNVGKAIVENTLVLLQALAIEPVPVHYVGV